MINNYKEAENYLNSFINYERRPFFPYKESLKLKRAYNLFEYLSIPYQQLRAIHIAGTKGKGSTAYFCSFLLAASGYEVGLYTSPHLFDFRERIAIVQSSKLKVQISLISKRDVVRIVEDFRLKLKKLRLSPELGKISFFEIYTALAFKYFLEKKVDLAILETGLGGRLDATNVVKPFVSVITHIGYDHTDKLGKKLSDIAYEKSGIIKEKVPVVCSSQETSSLAVIKNKCRLKKSSLFLLGRDFMAFNIRLKKNYTLFDFEFKDVRLKNLKISLKGKYQVENAALALAACCLLRKKELIRQKLNFRQGLRDLDISGRFEIVSRNPLIVVDIAHNVSSIAALNDNLKTYFPSKKIILIFSCSQDKDAKNMLRKISYSHLILTRFNNPRSFEPDELRKMSPRKEAYIADSIKEAFRKALELYTSDDWAIVISGSLFLVSEAKMFFRRHKAVFSQANTRNSL